MYLLFLYFVFYSFIGWMLESAYVSIEQKKFINRGFLNGPVCPIYGTGALIILYCLAPFSHNTFITFTAGLILTSTLEYIVGLLLEIIFKAKWWDYSKHKYNLNGRISLVNSLYWGALSVILLKFIHPRISYLVNLMPGTFFAPVSWILLLIMVIDIIITIPSIITLNIRLAKVHNLYEDLQEKINILPLLHEKVQELKERYNDTVSKKNILHSRIIVAFPSLRSIKFDKALKTLKSKIYTKRSK